MTVKTLIELLSRINSPDAIVQIEYTYDAGSGQQPYRDDATSVIAEINPEITDDRVVIR